MELAFRQVHLDFHTSELIGGIGADFDPDRFTATLKAAHVDSVTCFSRCHHGMIYHDTRFEARHPNLERNLLKEQIEACRKAGIRAPVYITVGFDEYQAKRHPEWLEVSPEGKLLLNGPLSPVWKKLCLNTPYLDYVLAQTEEVLEMFDVDGLFFDIILQVGCVCPWCLAGMKEAGLDPELQEDRDRFGQAVLARMRRRTTELVRKHNRDCTIFYNSGHVGPHFRDTLDTFTHLELESLPSGGWGYDHFPLTVRFARTLGVDLLGMTGKFQRSWGDFGGYKSPASLEYECFTALAEGAKCSVGDQLPPGGRLDPATYDLIGGVYASVENKEPWCRGAQPVTEVAVFTPEAIGRADGQVDSSAGGAMRMLLETHHQFDVVDGVSDWSRYKVVVMPDKVALDDALAAKTAAFLDEGGGLILSHLSGTGADEPGRFVLPGMPVTLDGESRFSLNYLEPRPPLDRDVPAAQYVMYEGGLEVRPVEGAQSMAEVWRPYFNRAWDHFVSHAHAPAEKPAGYPGAVRKERIIYFAHPLFRLYKKHGPGVCRQVFLNALDQLLPEPLVRTDAPSTARLTVMHQPKENRKVLHVLHYIPEHRYDEVHTVEDVIPLRNVRVGLRAPAPARVYLAPDDVELEFDEDDGRVWLTVPEVRGHAMVVLQY